MLRLIDDTAIEALKAEAVREAWRRCAFLVCGGCAANKPVKAEMNTWWHGMWECLAHNIREAAPEGTFPEEGKCGS